MQTMTIDARNAVGSSSRGSRTRRPASRSPRGLSPLETVQFCARCIEAYAKAVRPMSKRQRAALFEEESNDD
jgi:hypothetical protein